MSSLAFGPLVLGGNVFGWTADAGASFAVLDAFVDAGGHSIDTADVYMSRVPGNSGGESETIIGEWCSTSGRRDDVEIATKVCSHPARPGLSAANIAAAVDDSLRRLRTDRIDLYYAHRDDDAVSQEEYLVAFDALVQAGKVRELGASNFTAGRLRSAAAIAEREGLTPFTVAQDHYNLVERELERDLLPTLAELGVVELPYYALASGFLTGKYSPGGQPVDSQRAGRAAEYLDDPRHVELLAALGDVAATHGVGVSAVALAWLRAQPGVAAPIASARTPEQLAALVESFTLELSPAEVGQLGAITAVKE